MVPRSAAVVLAALALAACLLCLIGVAWADDEPLVTVSASQWAGQTAQEQAAVQGAAGSESLDEGASDIVDGTATSASPKDAENPGGSDRGMAVSGCLSKGEGNSGVCLKGAGQSGESSLEAITSVDSSEGKGVPGVSAGNEMASGISYRDMATSGAADGNAPASGDFVYDEEALECFAWQTCELPADLDGDGVQESLVAVGEAHDVRVSVGGVDVYASPDEWRVFDAHVCDLDGDGADELVFLVWKQGSYGPYRPFWESGPDDAWSQHVFVYGMRAGKIAPIWMSSALGSVFEREWMEPDGTLVLEAPDGSLTSWRWGSWGFELVGETRAERISLLFAGDVIAHQGMYEAAYDRAARTFDFSSVFAQVKDYISSFDIATVCQETALVRDAAKRSGYPEFATPATIADALVDAGFDVVASATNHVNDRGSGAIRETLGYWAEEHPHVGVAGLHDDASDVAAPVIVESGDFRLAYFNLTYGLNGHALPEDEEYLADTLEDKDAMLQEIAAVQGEVDLTVVILHMGQEYSSVPTQEQRQMVEEAIDAGADVVVCSHAHVVAPYGMLTTEAGATGLVYWGLGNFVASQGDIACQVGGIATIELEKVPGSESMAETRIVSFGLEPCVCHVGNDGAAQVYLLEDYTDELAAQHVLSSEGRPLCVDDFRQSFEAGIGEAG